MAMRIAYKAPQRTLTTFNGCQKIFARQFSCSHHFHQEPISQRDQDHTRESKNVFNRSTRHRSLELNAVDVTINGHVHHFSPILLRDLCQSPESVDSSTRQKLFATVDIPSDIRAKNVSNNGRDVHITWYNNIPGLPEDHTTVIPIRILQHIVETGKPVLPGKPLARSLWDAQMYDQETRDFGYEEYMNDDSILFSALQQLETHGLLFIKNVPESEQSVETVAIRIGPLKTTFYGRTWDVRSVPEAKNVAYTSQNLGFHMDLMYMKQPPHLQLLHCIRSSAAGGASLFSDSYKAVNDIAKSDFADFTTLSRLPVTYHYDHADHYYQQRRMVIEQAPKRMGKATFKDLTEYTKYKAKSPAALPDLSPMDFVEHVAWSPPFQGPFSVSSELSHQHGAPEGFLNNAIKTWHAAAKNFNDLIHRPEVVYERMMKPGECVIFDNRRVLHARKAFEVGDAGKERWLRGAYIDKDPYMSKLKVMTDQRKVKEEVVESRQFVTEQQEPVAAVA